MMRALWKIPSPWLISSSPAVVSDALSGKWKFLWWWSWNDHDDDDDDDDDHDDDSCNLCLLQHHQLRHPDQKLQSSSSLPNSFSSFCLFLFVPWTASRLEHFGPAFCHMSSFWAFLEFFWALHCPPSCANSNRPLRNNRTGCRLLCAKCTQWHMDIRKQPNLFFVMIFISSNHQYRPVPCDLGK